MFIQDKIYSVVSDDRTLFDLKVRKEELNLMLQYPGIFSSFDEYDESIEELHYVNRCIKMRSDREVVDRFDETW